MLKDISLSQWLCTGKSVRGAAHDRSGLPNQDAIDWYPQSGNSLPLILAVSDGHGSATSFRSDRGSGFAVTTAIEEIRAFLPDLTNESDPSTFQEIVTSRLLEKLSARWQEQVKQDLRSHQITDAERQTLISKDGEKALKSIQANPLLAYGATLLVVVVTDRFIVYLQLGDGDILRVDENGNTTRPLGKNPQLIANETTSLCMDKAWEQFEVSVEFYAQQTPALILVSTDGYANSYASDEKFFKIGQDYLQLIRSGGIASVESQLAEFLNQTSSGGSGDDISLGILKRIEELDFSRANLQQHPTDLAPTNVDGGDLMATADINQLKHHNFLNRRLAILAALLAIASTCLSAYLFLKLWSIDENLATVTKTSQKKLAELEQKITQLQSQQNTLTPDRQSAKKSDRKIRNSRSLNTGADR
jgi:DNA-binding transcriptional MerR regulator